MPFSIRVQTTLLASKCDSVVAHWKNPFIWRRYCGKKQIGGVLWVHNFLTTVMTNIVVDKSTEHTKPLSICLTLLLDQESDDNGDNVFITFVHLVEE